MAIYFAFGDGDLVQVATNMGWAEVRRAAQGSDLEALFETGEADDLEVLAEAFGALTTTKEHARHTIAGIIETLQSHSDQLDTVVVTDGMGPDA